MGLLDSSVGGLLGGTWANSYFFMLEIMEVYKYYRDYPHDSIFLKLLVSLTAAIDTLCTIGNYGCVYMYTVTHWGDLSFLLNQYWPIPVFLATTGASGFIVQSFLVHRYWRLSHNPWITLFLGLLILVAFSGSLTSTGMVVIFSSLSERNHGRIPITIWLVSSAVADILIAAALVIELRRIETQTHFENTHSLIRRISRMAIQTGAATSAVATISVVTYLIDNESNISVGFGYTLGRIYALTMLRNLNTRKDLMSGQGLSLFTNIQEPPIVFANTTSSGMSEHNTVSIVLSR